MSALEADDPTRRRLLEAASEVFSKRGFQAATIREICVRAKANVAAVNYHFRDKLGLYKEVLRHSLGTVQAEVGAALGESDNAEAEIRQFVLVLLTRMSPEHGSPSRIRIMAHELAQPSPALPFVVNQLIRPNYDRLRVLVGQILGTSPDGETARLCTHSLIGQVVHYVAGQPVISILWPELKLTASNLERIARHITDFSLCSLREWERKELGAGRTDKHGSTDYVREQSGKGGRAGSKSGKPGG